MKTPEYRTTPPRRKHYGVVGIVAGLLLSFGYFRLWMLLLPESQSRYAGLYIGSLLKAYLGAFLHIRSLGAKYHTLLPYFHVIYKDGFLSLFMWPLILSVLTVIVLAAAGFAYDERMMRELRKGRKIDGPDLDSVKEFNKRHKKDERGFGLRVEN